MRDHRRVLIWLMLLIVPFATALQTTHAQERPIAFDGASARIDQFWTRAFAARGWTYVAPADVVQHQGGGRIACGPTLVDGSTGPFYCVATRTIHVDLRFLQRATDAYGPTTILTATAHEWGHHVQILRGITAATNTRRERELQADCFAGAFIAADIRQGALARPEAAQARRFLRSIGARHAGADSDTSAHGTPDQRVAAFDRGLTGGVDACAIDARTTHDAAGAASPIETASPPRGRSPGKPRSVYESR